MKNTLVFSTIYKSITSLQTVDLPPFVVLTGRNGSGKTHLLEALKGGNITSSIAPNSTSDILVYDATTIVPKDTGRFDPTQERVRRSNWFTAIRNAQEKDFPTIRNAAVAIGVPSAICTSLTRLTNITVEELENELQDSVKGQKTYTALQAILAQHSSSIYQQTIRSAGDDFQKKLAPRLLQAKPKQFLTTSESRFFENELFLWEEVDPFQQAFGRVFTSYRDLIHSNDRLEKYSSGEEFGPQHLTPSEFTATYGPPPWEFVNEILEVCNLDFRVDYPPMHEISSYEPRLSKLATAVEMLFKDLSSGEKVLMSFALCLYNAEEARQEKVFPKLLLLDEIDAPLHPSMALSLLRTIEDVLVKKKGVFVILTTHSPSTVGLASEEAIYEMDSAGGVVRKVSKSSAVNLLSAGVPTLSMSFDGRRQVFVESKVDAQLYDKLYQRYKSEINSERSLVFVEVGRRDSTGLEQNSGCEQVSRLVEQLTSGGNNSVFGLVDWDGSRSQTDRIHVLSQNIRDGIESLLLDPVLLVASIIREKRPVAIQHGLLNHSESYTQLATWNSDRWQQAVRLLETLLLGSSEVGMMIKIRYVAGLELEVTSSYIHLDDHALERLVIEKFGFLRPFNDRAGGLLNHITETVLVDHPTLLPQDLLDTFHGLLQCEV